MTYVQELLGQVVSSLLRNKLRSFLTMAGIAWGVASIVPADAGVAKATVRFYSACRPSPNRSSLPRAT